MPRLKTHGHYYSLLHDNNGAPVKMVINLTINRMTMIKDMLPFFEGTIPNHQR